MNDKDVRIGQQIIHEDDLKIKVDYKGEIFTLKYPNPIMKSAIEGEIARRLGGFTRDCYPQDHVYMVIATTYVDNLIISKESPGWFGNAWECLDEELIGTLYGEYLSFRSKFQEKLKQGQYKDPDKGRSS